MPRRAPRRARIAGSSQPAGRRSRSRRSSRTPRAARGSRPAAAARRGARTPSAGRSRDARRDLPQRGPPRTLRTTRALGAWRRPSLLVERWAFVPTPARTSSSQTRGLVLVHRPWRTSARRQGSSSPSRTSASRPWRGPSRGRGARGSARLGELEDVAGLHLVAMCLKRRFQFFGIVVPPPVRALRTSSTDLLVDHLPQPTCSAFSAARSRSYRCAGSWIVRYSRSSPSTSRCFRRSRPTCPPCACAAARTSLPTLFSQTPRRTPWRTHWRCRVLPRCESARASRIELTEVASKEPLTLRGSLA